MKRTLTVFGLIAGLIVSAVLIISLPAMRSAQGEMPGYSMYVGFGSMLLAFSLIFVAVKTQRDKRQGGTISFGQAFGLGAGIAFIASVCYTITWAILFKNFYPSFMDDMIRAELTGMTRNGATEAAIGTKRAELETMRATYSTWPGLIGWTMLEILPLGLLVALVAALVLKRRQPQRKLA